MRMGTVLSRPETFLRAHRESPDRLEAARELLEEVATDRQAAAS
jgi:hypothetical protein